LASSEPECEPSRSASAIPTAKPSCESTGQLSLFTTTCEPLPPKLLPTPSAVSYGSNQGGGMGRVGPVRYSLDSMARKGLMSSVAAYPVRTSALPERARALRASAAAYGQSSPELLARYDRATSSWRTSQLCLDGELSVFSETWPRSGLMRNGTAYQLPPLVRLTDATGFGSWPTPTADDADNVTRKSGQYQSLTRTVKMWPTPHSSMSTGVGTQGRDGGQNLQTAIGGSLNPTWVEWLMGFPLGWTDLGRWAMPSSRKSRKSSGGQS
jgi:hypothetical protein